MKDGALRRLCEWPSGIQADVRGFINGNVSKKLGLGSNLPETMPAHAFNESATKNRVPPLMIAAPRGSLSLVTFGPFSGH